MVSVAEADLICLLLESSDVKTQKSQAISFSKAIARAPVDSGPHDALDHFYRPCPLRLRSPRALSRRLHAEMGNGNDRTHCGILAAAVSVAGK